MTHSSSLLCVVLWVLSPVKMFVRVVLTFRDEVLPKAVLLPSVDAWDTAPSPELRPLTSLLKQKHFYALDSHFFVVHLFPKRFFLQKPRPPAPISLNLSFSSTFLVPTFSFAHHLTQHFRFASSTQERAKSLLEGSSPKSSERMKHAKHACGETEAMTIPPASPTT